MDLTDAFTDTISFKEPTGTRGAHGDPDFSTSTLQTASARVEVSQRLITNSMGEEVMASHFVMCSAAISLFARVWLPGTDTSDPQQMRRPLRVDPCTDLDGVASHWEVYF